VATKNRDNFSERTKLQIAKRAGWLCSFPTCRKPTVGATSDGEGEINVGTAAHICAAAPGGPRYDEDMSPEERASAKNGIWMCRDHGKAIDSTDPEFTVERLREWKRQAENESWRLVLRNETPREPAVAADMELVARIRKAAEADLKIFQQTVKWPSTPVALTLKVDGFDNSVTTSALARAVMSLNDLILVAGPGMGKTTTLFQIAEGMLASSNGMPFVVPLGDWATEGVTVLESILKRSAFRGISERDFRNAAAQPGIVLLLDGWNELDTQARARARVQVSRLKAELTELGLVVSTRRQALDVPFGGTRVDLLPLDEDQQMQIAVAMRGDTGAKVLDQAWRTAGVRELVTIPLYLTSLLSLPENTPSPTTKEEVLRHFVSAHETDASRAEALRAALQGLQQDYLDGLAVFATRTANTALAESDARRSIFETEKGQAKKWSYPGMEKAVQTMRKQIEGVSSLFTLDACRHGGMTELEEAELTDGQGRALSGHKTTQAYKGYAKETMQRALAATRKRHAHLLTQRQLEQEAQAKAGGGEQISTEFRNKGTETFRNRHQKRRENKAIFAVESKA